MRNITAPRLQRAIQYLFLGLSLFVGWRFYLFCAWAQAGGAPVARPAGVEGFLPISALLGFTHLVRTGTWDPAHPAGLAIFLVALATGLLLRRGFCAFICPVGLVSNLVSEAGRRLGLERRVPRLANGIARVPKYLLLGFFLATGVLGMNGPALERFLMSRYNLTADAHLLTFFLHPSATALAVLAALAAATLLWRNAWCRWLCPYGALLGLLSLACPTRVERNEESCTHCRRCSRACPSGIAVHEKTRVRTPECLGCARCVDACPEAKTLGMTALGRPLHWAAVGLASLGIFVLAWAAAKLTGHWDSSLPPQMLKALYAAALGG